MLRKNVCDVAESLPDEWRRSINWANPGGSRCTEFPYLLQTSFIKYKYYSQFTPTGCEVGSGQGHRLRIRNSRTWIPRRMVVSLFLSSQVSSVLRWLSVSMVICWVFHFTLIFSIISGVHYFFFFHSLRLVHFQAKLYWGLSNCHSLSFGVLISFWVTFF